MLWFLTGIVVALLLALASESAARRGHRKGATILNVLANVVVAIL